jgi:hypothetical protein
LASEAIEASSDKDQPRYPGLRSGSTQNFVEPDRTAGCRSRIVPLMTQNATHELLAMALACSQVIDNFLSVSSCQWLLLRTGL